MRLIDADALIADLEHDVAMDQDSLDNEELTEINRENIQFDKDCKQNAIDLLQHAPTIEEQKKGRWIWKTSDIYRCSECNIDSHVAECMEEPIYNFCPYCGADMRGEQNE